MESRQRDNAAGHRGARLEEEGDIDREYKAMHEENFFSSWLREVGKNKEERIMEVDLWQILRYARRAMGGRIFEIFSSKGQSEHLVAFRVRCDERQRPMTTQEEEARRNGQEVDNEVNQNWTAVYQMIAKRMLKSWEDSEALKVSTRDKSCLQMRIARQARSEKSKKLFQIFEQTRSKRDPSRQYGETGGAFENIGCSGEGECLALGEEVEHLNEKQEVLATLMEVKMSMQKVVLEKYEDKSSRS